MAQQRFFDVLAKESVTIAATATLMFPNIPPDTKMVRFTVPPGGLVVFQFDGQPGSVTDGHVSGGETMRLTAVDAANMYALDYYGGTVAIFVTYFSGRLLTTDL